MFTYVNTIMLLSLVLAKLILDTEVELKLETIGKISKFLDLPVSSFFEFSNVKLLPLNELSTQDESNHFEEISDKNILDDLKSVKKMIDNDKVNFF